MEALLPSEVARLVYGYLIEEHCPEAAKTFLETSKHLKECLNVQKRGRKFQTKIGGKNLTEFLDLLFEALNEAKLLAEKLPLDSEAMKKILSLLQIFSIEIPLKSDEHGFCRECKVEESINKKINYETTLSVNNGKLQESEVNNVLQREEEITSVKNTAPSDFEPKDMDDSIDVESSDSNSDNEIDKSIGELSSEFQANEPMEERPPSVQELHSEDLPPTDNSFSDKETGNEQPSEIKMEVLSEGEDVIEVEVVETPSKRPRHQIMCKPLNLLQQESNKDRASSSKVVYRHILPQVSPKPQLPCTTVPTSSSDPDSRRMLSILKPSLLAGVTGRSYSSIESAELNSATSKLRTGPSLLRSVSSSNQDERMAKKSKFVPSDLLRTYTKKSKLDVNNPNYFSLPKFRLENGMFKSGKQIFSSSTSHLTSPKSFKHNN